MALHIALSRRGARDPVVNGYTRLAGGALTDVGPILGAAGPGSNQTAFIGLPGARDTTVGTVESLATQLFDDLGSDHALAGVALAGPPNILLFHGTALVPSSLELWVNNVKIAQSAVTAGAKRTKLALEPGRVRAWVDGAVVYDGAPAGLPASVTAQLFLQTDANVGHVHATTAYWNQSKVTLGNSLLFRRCPANGSVIVNVGAGADQIVPLDVLGSGGLDLGGSSVPVKARYRLYDGPGASGALLADLTIPYAYGGDVLGLLTIPLTPTDPATFTITRNASGLLFRDDFARADGAPGANWIIEAGAWAIVGGKLAATCANGALGYLSCAALANRLNWHAQLNLSRGDLLSYLNTLLRRNGATWYNFAVAASNDGTDPNKARLYRKTAGADARLSGGALPGVVAGVAMRFSFSTLGTSQTGYIDGGNLTVANDGTAGNQAPGGLAFESFGAGVTSTATIDDVVLCTDRVVAALRVPIGYAIRIGGLTSAASVNGDLMLDLLGIALPAAQLEVLDGGGNVVRTLIPADGVWGGDQYLCH